MAKRPAKRQAKRKARGGDVQVDRGATVILLEPGAAIITPSGLEILAAPRLRG